jgi:hypothetical protein
MKIARIALLLILLTLALTVMSGCRCTPYKPTWYFYSYKADMEFMNGVTKNLGFSDASNAYPFAGAGNSQIGISFSKDGKVEFTTLEGETLHGTYTYAHTSINFTSFTITLENGETIEGNSYRGIGKKRLALTYKDVIYNFTNEEKSQFITMDDIIASIKAGNREKLNMATVIKTENGFSVKYSDLISYPIAEETAVFAITIHADGTYTVLDELYEGEVLSTYNNDANYVVIYYLEK